MAFEMLVNQCVLVPRYEDLKTAYLDYIGNRNPCGRNVPNQCAVRMSTALVRSGFSIEGMRLVHSGRNCGYDIPHVTASLDLANFIKQHWPPPRVFNGGSIPDSLKLVKGVIFFKNCFTRGNGSRGNHIDLWDGTNIYNQYLGADVGGGTGSRTSRIFSNAKKVWFFPLA